jgi:DUF4097 and DUF4098 domain-containing protein YvlB
MKTFTTILFTLIVSAGFAQSFTETITKEFKFEKASPQNTLILANINGNVKVEGYAGDKILIEAQRSIKAKTNERLEKGKQEMQLRQIDNYDTIIFYVGNNCTKFGYQHNKKGRGNWGYNWNCDDDDCRDQYDYKFDFTIKVPAGVNVDVSTVNDGNVSIKQVKGAIKAGNVNGAIALMDLEGRVEANTINGDVDFNFVKNPTGYCRFYTLNGDINAYFQKGLAANMSFKSFNGDLYTNLEKLESIPMEVEKVKGENGYHLKVGGSKYKVGTGGPTLEFETFNGNAIVKER